jgi:hypothetical protein
MAKKGEVARLNKFNPAVYNQIDQYLSMCGRENMSLPTIEGLAGHIGVDSDTIRNWAKVVPEFSSRIKKMVDKQKQQLMEDGMYGGKEVNAAMAIFLLKANHGMSDGSAKGFKVKGDNMELEFIEIG